MSSQELSLNGDPLLSAQQEQLQPDGLTQAKIFSKENGFLLTDLGSRLQGIFLDMKFLNSDNPPDPESAKEIRARIKRTCEKFRISDDEGSLRQFGMKFYELVRQRYEEAGEPSRPVLTGV